MAVAVVSKTKDELGRLFPHWLAAWNTFSAWNLKLSLATMKKIKKRERKRKNEKFMHLRWKIRYQIYFMKVNDKQIKKETIIDLRIGKSLNVEQEKNIHESKEWDKNRLWCMNSDKVKACN